MIFSEYHIKLIRICQVQRLEGYKLESEKTRVKLQKHEDVEWIRFLNFYFYLDRINQSPLKLRPGMQDYQEFFACGEGLSAEGRIILTILLILSKLFSYRKNPFLFFNLVSYLIRLDARGQRPRL